MRDFFINSLEVIISIVLVIMSIAVVIGGLVTMFTESFFGGIGILIGGSIYVLLFGGLMFLGLGIYQNTKRTAEAIERLR